MNPEKEVTYQVQIKHNFWWVNFGKPATFTLKEAKRYIKESRHEYPSESLRILKVTTTKEVIK